MLTADLVRVKREGGTLKLSELKPKTRLRMLELAAEMIGLAQALVGDSRSDFDEAKATVEVRPGDIKIAQGLWKLIEDRCVFNHPEGVDPVSLRAELFSSAAAMRRSGAFDRQSLLNDCAVKYGSSPELLENQLFSDLRQADVLQSFETCTPEILVQAYEDEQAQAVLLRATSIEVDVESDDPAIYRVLFRKLKFLQLLFEIEPLENGYRLSISGPYNLFQGATKYGLKLAMLLPSLRACRKWHLVAKLLWGREQEPLTFHLEGESALAAHGLETPLADDVAALMQSFAKLDSRWEILRAEQIFTLPGRGVCVPDLVFRDKTRDRSVYLEVMGYWSRDAVWRRIELCEAGLGVPIIFAVSSRLRVSPEALQEPYPSRLYVYKGVMSAKGVLQCLESLDNTLI